MLKLKQLLMAGALALTTVFGSGCALFVIGAAAGAGSYAYVKGELRTEEDVSVATAFRASQDGLAALGFTVKSASSDELQGKVEASGAEDRMVTVAVERVASGKTRIGVRIGTFGDRDQAAVILDEIRRKAGIR